MLTIPAKMSKHLLTPIRYQQTKEMIPLKSSLVDQWVWLWIIIGTRVKATYRSMDNLWVVTPQKKRLPLPRAMIYPCPCWQHGLVKPLILPVTIHLLSCEPPSPAGENVTGSSLARDVGSHDTDLEGNSSQHPEDRVLQQLIRNKAASY